MNRPSQRVRSRRSLPPFLFALITLGLGAGASAGEAPALLGDLNREPASAPANPFSYLAPSQLTALGERVLFVTEGVNSGRQCLLFSLSLRTGAVRRLASVERSEISRTCFVRAGVIGGSAFYLSPRNELWRSDGTPAGTRPVPGLTGWKAAGVGGEVTDALGTQHLVFPACTGTFECGLWTTDGTAAGTAPLANEATGPIGEAYIFVPWRGRLYFFASSLRQGMGLFATDGTRTGTEWIAGVDAQDELAPLLAATPSHLFFTSFGEGEELWVSEGTAAGTRRLRTFQAYGCSRFHCGQFLDALRVEGDEVAFAAHDGEHGVQLWASDGTPAGTRRLTELPDGFVPESQAVRHLGERWLLAARPGNEGGALGAATLWTSLGAPATTARLLGPACEACEVCAGDCPEPTLFLPHDAQPAGHLVFVGRDAAHGSELWSTDGTAPGTRRLTDVCAGPCSSFDELSLTWPLSPVAGEGRLFFFPSTRAAQGGILRDLEAWSTDGTPAGTERCLTEGLASLAPLGSGLAGRLVGGSAGGAPFALRLWSTDGTARGTRLEGTLLEDKEENEGSTPGFVPTANGALVLTGDIGRRLLRTDGTVPGTVPIPGPPGLPGREPVWLNAWRCGRFTYLARRLSSGATGEEPFLAELWRTDGSPGSTQRLVRFPPNHGFTLDFAAEWQERCVFVAGGGGKQTLWVSDGSAAGTQELFPFPSGIRFAASLLGVGSRFLFLAWTEEVAGLVPQLFSSAGSWEDTRQLTAFEGARDAFSLPRLIRVGPRVAFLVPRRDFRGNDLWITDGTVGGTRPLFPRLAGPAELTSFQGALVFSALPDESSCAKGLYRWRPGEGEPQLLALSRGEPGSCVADSQPLEPVAAGDRLFFAAFDGEAGREPWVSDGTAAGTHQVRDLWPGPGSSSPRRLTAAGRRVYFYAEDGAHGEELWRSDGTSEGTMLVADLNPGLRGSGVSFLRTPMTFSAGKLYFAADDGVHGVEPWALEVEP